MELRVAARGSLLSVIQVREAMSYIAHRLGEQIKYKLVKVKTRGDIIKDKPLHGIRGGSLFEKEVDKAVLEGRADIAVHSMKDLPSKLPNGLEILAVAPRGTPNESLVPARGKEPLSLERVPRGSRIAAGSPRRKFMVKNSNSSVEVTWIRGNIDTRLRKLDEGMADYLVVAEAALERLKIERARVVLPLEKYVPAPGQGIVAIVGLRDSSIARKLRAASHTPTRIMAEAERAFLSALGGVCGKPVGGVAGLDDGVEFIAALYLEGRSLYVKVKARDPVEAGLEAAEAVKSAPWW